MGRRFEAVGVIADPGDEHRRPAVFLTRDFQSFRKRVMSRALLARSEIDLPSKILRQQR